MPQVIAFFQKQGRLPSAQEVEQLNPEQAKFCTIVGTCATGLITTLVTGKPESVISALVTALLPLIPRSKCQHTNTPPIMIALVQPEQNLSELHQTEAADCLAH